MKEWLGPLLCLCCLAAMVGILCREWYIRKDRMRSDEMLELIDDQGSEIHRLRKLCSKHGVDWMIRKPTEEE